MANPTARFPMANADHIQLLTAAPVAADPYVPGGYRQKADNSGAYGATTGGFAELNGLLLDAVGRIIYVDATAGLPANTQWASGLPLAPSGALCISTGATVVWSDGVPFVANGAVAAVVT